MAESTKWKKGQSGNPLGSKPDKPFLDALRRAIVQDDGKRLRKAAENVLTAAADGEPWAINFLADRTDGKSVQQSELNIVKRTIIELSDDELLTIASREGTVEAEGGEEVSSSIH